MGLHDQRAAVLAVLDRLEKGNSEVTGKCLGDSEAWREDAALADIRPSGKPKIGPRGYERVWPVIYREALEQIVATLGPNPTAHMRKIGFDCEGCLFEVEEAYYTAKDALDGLSWEDRWKDVDESFEVKKIEFATKFEEHQKNK